MDPSKQEPPHGSSEPSSSMFPKTIEPSKTSSDAPALKPPKRTLSVQFLDNRAEEDPAMSRDRTSADTDEITPIRTADGNADRTYRTTESESTNGVRNASKPSTSSDTTPQAEERFSWWKRLSDRYGSITLENKGSVARDHLALERTFLAWLRTSLAFASIGVAITQLFRLNTSIQTKSQSLVAVPSHSRALPLSPLLGYGLPPELIPLLQQLADAGQQLIPSPVPTNTILDQLLFAQSPGFDDDAATKLRRIGKPLGATFIGISIIVLLIGFHRYFESQYWVIRGKFPASRGSISFVGFIAGALIVASLIVVLIVAPVSYRKP